MGNKLQAKKLKRKLQLIVNYWIVPRKMFNLKKVDRIGHPDGPAPYSQHMHRLSNNMEQLTHSITLGFLLLQDLLFSQQQYQQSSFHKRGGYSYTGLSASSSGHLSPI